MNRNTKRWSMMTATLASGLVMFGTVTAAEIICTDPEINHMSMDDSQASACLASGLNTPAFTGNAQDVFLTDSAGSGYDFIEKSEGTGNPTDVYSLQYDQSGSDGTWQFDGSLWSTFDTVALGFKFGTGNQPDNWFVYELQPNVSSGDWAFFGGNTGGGLSNVALYGKESVSVPEPGTLALFGLGLVGLTLARRKNRTN